MTSTSFANRWNIGAIEAAYERWRQDPASVDEQWRLFFEGFDLGAARTAGPAVDSTNKQTGIIRLIDAYRALGHFLARLDPLGEPKASHPQLELSEFGLDEGDLGRTFDTSHFLGLPRASLRELIAALRETYCRTIGVEYMHIQDLRIRRWLQERMESRHNLPNFTRRQKLGILMDINFAELFEKFLHTRFVGQKRFSLEGAETLIPILDAITRQAADGGVREVVMGMSHRGRLNVLANILGKPYQEIFAEFDDNLLPNSVEGDGDVKYHLGFSADRTTAAGSTIHISLTPNPSHLEAVDPVVEGRTRAKQFDFRDEDRARGIPLLIHGDAAFAGQGLVAETLNLAQLVGYQTGGTLHVIVNNQIGFTTSPTDARSTVYCTDVAKMIQVPIFHVNGEDPEAAVYLAELALEFRQAFNKDVVIDMYCYRRHGHNEGDEPSFTQPLMYAKIKERPTLGEIYVENLIMTGALTTDEAEALQKEFEAKLGSALDEVKSRPLGPGMAGYQGRWQGLTRQYNWAAVETGVAYERLRFIADRLGMVPDTFTANPKIRRILDTRAREVEERKPLDWALAEGLAFGALLLERTPIRLSGQDSRRGTFSQRHAVLFDALTGDAYIPLNNLAPDQAPLRVYDSLLSEAAVLGFEFGYSWDSPDKLVLWEAQFGDFANGAQVIIDQFIVCSNSKWQRDSGLVLLLPHGYEGQGPEHSSARLERFLPMLAEDNIQVVYPTTPAQYFHLLRRQMKRDFRKPLVVMTPKSLLRHKGAMSPVEEFVSGRFHEILDDADADPGRVRRVLLCSGKVYYDLLEKRGQDQEGGAAAVLRVEQFYPFPHQQLDRALARYRKAKEWAWVQEESMNMGGWTFMEPRLRAMGYDVKYVGRDASASPATGSRQVHLREQRELVEAALSGPLPHLVRAVPEAARKLRREYEEQDQQPAAEPLARTRTGKNGG